MPDYCAVTARQCVAKSRCADCVQGQACFRYQPSLRPRTRGFQKAPSRAWDGKNFLPSHHAGSPGSSSLRAIGVAPSRMTSFQTLRDVDEDITLQRSASLTEAQMHRRLQFLFSKFEHVVLNIVSALFWAREGRARRYQRPRVCGCEEHALRHAGRGVCMSPV